METTAIIWTMEGRIIDQKKFRQSMDILTSRSYAETGTKTHWWNISEDGESFHVLEEYADADAAMAHLATWSQFGDLFLKATIIEKYIIYSPLRDDLKEAVAGLNPIYMTFYGGFSK